MVVWRRGGAAGWCRAIDSDEQAAAWAELQPSTMRYLHGGVLDIDIEPDSRAVVEAQVDVVHALAVAVGLDDSAAAERVDQGGGGPPGETVTHEDIVGGAMGDSVQARRGLARTAFACQRESSLSIWRRALRASCLASARGPHQPDFADEFFAPACSVLMRFGRATQPA